MAPPPPPPPPEAEWMYLGCGADNVPPLLSGLNPTRKLDYAAIYASRAKFADYGVTPATIEVYRVSATGTACATATDAAACRAALDGLLVPAQACSDGFGLCEPFLVITGGDEVSRVGERAALRALLGDIDTPAEAALIALLLGGQRVGCADTFSQPLAGTEARAVEDGYEVRTEWEDCGNGVFSRTVHVSADGTVTELAYDKIANSNCAIGRRPEGLSAARPTARTPLGAYFASAATLEAASVFAFERLARELSALAAPQQLVASAARSALEEIRHARVVGALARGFGGEPAAPQVPAHAPRGALAIALENAVEGCVRETYGALVAHFQAQTASDPRVRAALREIAEDESGHAALAWQIAGWLEPQLAADERRAVDAARAAALSALRDELDPRLPETDRARIGLPDAQLGAALLDRLAAALGLPA